MATQLGADGAFDGKIVLSMTPPPTPQPTNNQPTLTTTTPHPHPRLHTRAHTLAHTRGPHPLPALSLRALGCLGLGVLQDRTPTPSSTTPQPTPQSHATTLCRPKPTPRPRPIPAPPPPRLQNHTAALEHYLVSIELSEGSGAYGAGAFPAYIMLAALRLETALRLPLARSWAPVRRSKPLCLEL